MTFSIAPMCLVLVLSTGVCVNGQCVPRQLHKLEVDDGLEQDNFGLRVAISGTTVIVAESSGGTGGDLPKVHLFDTTNGFLIASIVAESTADGFSSDVGISGDTAIVGANGQDDNGTNSGSVFLFSASTGQPIDELFPNDPESHDAFGHVVALSGSTAIVGSPEDDDNGDSSGSAYVFDVTTGKQTFKLLPNDGGFQDRFSRDQVAVSGNIAIIGAYQDDDNGDSSGSAYLFDITTGQQTFKLLPNDGAPDDRFGRSVSISGAIAIVGAAGDDDNGNKSGSAYLFDVATGKQVCKLLPNDGATDDNFGISVAVSGTVAIVGASGDNDNGEDSGSAYLFNTKTGQQMSKVLADDGVAEDGFGFSVGIEGPVGIVGAPSSGFGAAYLFDISDCTVVLGDVNLDGEVDLLDVHPFVDLLVSGGYQAEADINQDGVVDLLDVQPFVELLTG